jgi:hypothetical protein
MRALYSLACCGVRCFRTSSFLSASSLSICFLITSLCWSPLAMASAKSFAPGGLTYITAGYSPTRILSVSGGRISGSRITWPFSSTGHPRFACQSYEWRKSTRASAALLDRISDCHKGYHSAEDPDVGVGAVYGWISTPSSMPSRGEILIIFHPARSSDPYMLRAALLASASGTNPMIAWRPPNSFSGSILVFVLPTDQNGITRGALQTARFINDFSNSARLASNSDIPCSSLVSSCVNLSVWLDTAFALYWAWPADLLAASAEFLASPDCCVTSASSWSLLLRNSPLLVRSEPLIDVIFTPTRSSPTIPPVTSKTPMISTTHFLVDGLSGERIVPRRQASMSLRRSRQITQSSIATPSATKAVNHGSDRSQGTDELSKAVMSLSSADMALCRAEASIGRLEALWIKCTKFTIVALPIVRVYRI